MNYKVRIQESEEGFSISCPGLPSCGSQGETEESEKAGFRIVRQDKHVVMSDGVRILTIARHNPVNAFTMVGIVKDAGLSVE